MYDGLVSGLEISGLLLMMTCFHCSIIEHLKSHGWEDELASMGDNPKRELFKIPCLSKE